MHHWMFNCKEITRMVSESMDRNLPVHQRMGIRIHLLMCKFCSRYRRQLFFIRETLRLHTDQIEDVQPSVTLPPETRDRIKQFCHHMLEQHE